MKILGMMLRASQCKRQDNARIQEILETHTAFRGVRAKFMEQRVNTLKAHIKGILVE